MKGLVDVSGRLGLLYKKPATYVLVFFLLYLSIGLSVYRDYGISWDEPMQWQHGIVSAKYLASVFLPSFQPQEFLGIPKLADYPHNEYSVIFTLPMYVVEVILGYESGTSAESFYFRHLCTFLIFYTSVFFFYLIIRNRFNNWAMGLTGCLFLIMSPRIFAESFYNLKDIVFLSFFIIAIYFFIRFLNNKTFMNSFLFALTSAFAVDQRMPGVIIPFVAVIISTIDAMKTESLLKVRIKSLFPLLVYLVSFIIFMVLFWPYLWENPIQNIIHAFVKMSRYSWSGTVLYMGDLIKAKELPWHYIPVWLLITTPIIYSVLFVLGFFQTLREIMRNGYNLYSNDKGRQDFLFLLLFFVPLATVIVMKAVLYDGWRQMYFIYAPFLLIAMKGLAQVLRLMGKTRAISRSCVIASILIGFIVLSVVLTSYQMITYHPFQNVFFNLLAGRNVGQKFERDYWGLSYRQGLEYIVKNDKRPIIKLAANESSCMLNNVAFLEEQDTRRLMFVKDPQEADYFLSAYRWHPQQYEYKNEVYTVYSNDLVILSVFKIR